MKKSPLFVLLIITTLLFTSLGIFGRNNVYALENSDIAKAPYLSNVFTGIHNGRAPWNVLIPSKRQAAVEEAEEEWAYEERLKANKAQMAMELDNEESAPILERSINLSYGYVQALGLSNHEVEEEIEVIRAQKLEEKAAKAPAVPDYTPRYAPMRESTYEEYKAHVSADIYGDDGERFALSYPDYKNVSLDYFNDALFVGDSRTVGLRNYTALNDHATFLCETSMTIWKIMEASFKGMGTLDSYLTDYSYGKIYIMVGINEMGTGTTEKFLEKYTEVVDHIRELQPDAIIYIQSIMNVDREKSESDAIFNNDNVIARNHALATLADNETIFYLDINAVVCDEEGFLRDDLRGDHLHLMGASNLIWENFLQRHAVIKNPEDEQYIEETGDEQ